MMRVDSAPYLAWGSLKELVRLASAEPMPAMGDAALADAAVRGDSSAADALIRHHLRIVVDAAAKHRGSGVSMDDLVRCGVDALVAATRDFRRERDGDFTGYARRRVRASIQAAVLQH